jgi:hypothetical protein
MTKYTGQPSIDRAIRNYDVLRSYKLRESSEDLRTWERSQASANARQVKWTKSALAVIACYRRNLFTMEELFFDREPWRTDAN